MSAKLFRLLGLACILLFLVVPALSEDTVPKPPIPVEVANFPDPQDVAGTVDVGNLPMDEEGNLKVKVVNQSDLWKVVDVNMDLIVPAGSRLESNVVDVAGYNSISFHFDATGKFTDITISFRNKEGELLAPTYYLAWETTYGFDDAIRAFYSRWDWRRPAVDSRNFSVPVSGKEAVLIMYNQNSFDITVSITAYLSR